MSKHRSPFVSLLVASPLFLGLFAAGCEAPIGGAGPVDASFSEDEIVALAREIHGRIITLDTHKDMSPTLASQDFPEDPDALAAFRTRNDPTVDGSNKVDFPKMLAGGYDAPFYIVYVGQTRGAWEDGYANALQLAMGKFAAIHRMVQMYPDYIELAYGPDDVRRIADSGKLVACIGIENGYPMGENLSLISLFKDLGAGYMGITHNGNNQLGDSQSSGETERSHGGLSELGVKAVAEMNRVGIMVDVSHSNKATMMHAVRVSVAPIIASHSSCRALTDVGRNLDDEQLMALKENGGVIQICALGGFVKSSGPRNQAVDALRADIGLPAGGGRGGRGRGGRGRGGRGGGGQQMTDAQRQALDAGMASIEAQYPPANVQDFADHIDHAVQTIGIDHVGISSDFDGGGGIQGWNDASESFNVTLELVRRGYTEAEIAQLWSGNTLRVWGEVQDIGRALQAN